MCITHQRNIMKKIGITIVGTAALLMHSDRFANPRDPLTKAHKELTGKRTKTDDDHEAIARSEFIGGCYWRKNVGFYLPSQNLDSCIVGGAKLQKLGVKFKQGVVVVEDELPLEGFESATPEALWEDPDHVDARGVKVGTAKIIRYRPIFRQWKARATVAINEDVVNVSEVKKAIQDAGALIGVGDNRPRFGRFAVEFS
ncbi:MAG: hypothetical protein ABI790_05280 [Betaproteobacteria bacterium]